MKRLGFFLLAVVLTVSMAGCGGGGGGSEEGGPDPVGTWSFTYDWGCNGLDGASTYHIYESGEFAVDVDPRTGVAFNGSWTLADGTLTLMYTTGTYYVGSFLDGDTLSGTMTSPQFSLTGCWSASRIDRKP